MKASESKVIRETKAIRGRLDPKGLKAFKEWLVRLVPLAHKVRKESVGCRACRAYRGRKATRATVESGGCKEHKESKAPEATKEIRGIGETKG